MVCFTQTYACALNSRWPWGLNPKAWTPSVCNARNQCVNNAGISSVLGAIQVKNLSECAKLAELKGPVKQTGCHGLTKLDLKGHLVLGAETAAAVAVHAFVDAVDPNMLIKC